MSAAATPKSVTMLTNVYNALKKADAALENTTYHFSGNNALLPGWLIQSAPSDKSCQLLQTITNLLMTQVQSLPSQPHFIDILQLANNKSTDAFQGQIIDDIINIGKVATQPVIIRYLEGNDSTKTEAECFTFLDHLQNSYPAGSPMTHVYFYAASLDVPWTSVPVKQFPGSWNHSKIFAIDGVFSIVGGQNYWDDYLGGPAHVPPHDVSMHLNGSATVGAHSYANFLWNFVASSSRGAHTWNKSWQLGAASVGTDQPPAFDSTAYVTPPGIGTVPVLAVGNLGLWFSGESGTLASELVYAMAADQVSPQNTYDQIKNAYNPLLYFPFSSFDMEKSKASQASVAARHLLLGQVSTNGHIRISQQKIADTDVVGQTNTVIWPGMFLDALVNAMKDKNVTVEIIVSYWDSNSSTPVGGYSDDMGAKALKGVIIDHLAKALGGDLSKAKTLAGTLLTVKETPVNTATGGWESNHGKIWIVDDDVFYVGSDNIYPGYLQEYGYVIGDQSKTQDFITNYWTPLWNHCVIPT